MNLVIDFLRLRLAVGVLGFFLPATLYLLAGPAPSLSDYYHTPARDVFVVVCGLVAALLLSYRGYDRGDRIASATAGLGLLVVALAPVDGPWHVAHVAGAAAFFGAVAVLCERFGRGGYRRRTFMALGVVILAAPAAAGLGVPLLPAESAAVMAFGAAWLLKGRALERIQRRIAKSRMATQKGSNPWTSP